MSMISQWLTKIKGNPVNPSLPECLAIAGGRHIHLAPLTGVDIGRDGKSPDKSVKSFTQSLGLATAGQNDIIFLHGEGNAAASCTIYQSSTLTWSKDMVHLIGQHSGVRISPRARIAFLSSYDTASNLLTISANACRFSGIQFYAGVAGTNPTGCVKVTGHRNKFVGCHFAGIGHANNDIAGAYSLLLDGAQENEFENCVFGLQTVGRGAALNAELLFDGAAKNNRFKDCLFYSQVTHATNHVLIATADATAIDGFNFFENCEFLYQSANYAVGATAVARMSTLTQGYLVMSNCRAMSDKSGTTILWDVNNADKIILFGPVITGADSNGVGKLT